MAAKYNLNQTLHCPLFAVMQIAMSWRERIKPLSLSFRSAGLCSCNNRQTAQFSMTACMAKSPENMIRTNERG
ncbi:MAG: hypothetical protein R6U58_00420 [Bacteroidales bacterium]